MHLQYFIATHLVFIFLDLYVLRQFSDYFLINIRLLQKFFIKKDSYFFVLKAVRPLIITAFGLVFFGNLLYSLQNKGLIVIGRFIAGFGMGMEGALLGMLAKSAAPHLKGRMIRVQNDRWSQKLLKFRLLKSFQDRNLTRTLSEGIFEFLFVWVIF